jgi:hypothetical protein
MYINCWFEKPLFILINVLKPPEWETPSKPHTKNENNAKENQREEKTNPKQKTKHANTHVNRTIPQPTHTTHPLTTTPSFFSYNQHGKYNIKLNLYYIHIRTK